MTVFADTFALIAWLNPRDDAHAIVAAYLDGFTGRLVTTEWVLMEVADALSAPEARTTAVAFSPGTLFENCGRNTDVKNIIHGRCAYQPPPRAAFRDLPASSLGLLARLPSGRGRVGTRSRRRRLQTIAQLRRLPRQALHLA